MTSAYQHEALTTPPTYLIQLFWVLGLGDIKFRSQEASGITVPCRTAAQAIAEIQDVDPRLHAHA